MAIKCKYCEETKDDSLMAIRAGKPSKVCLECKQSRTGLGAGAPSKKKKTRRGKAEKAVDLRLTIPGGGYGFDAFLTDDGGLQITQPNDGTAADNVVLSKGEARAIFEKFGEWAGAEA